MLITDPVNLVIYHLRKSMKFKARSSEDREMLAAMDEAMDNRIKYPVTKPKQPMRSIEDLIEAALNRAAVARKIAELERADDFLVFEAKEAEKAKKAAARKPRAKATA